MPTATPPVPPSTEPPERPADSERTGLLAHIRRLALGAPLDLRDTNIGQHLALAAFLAWVGLGADGLSSSAYGPEEAFKAVIRHPSLAILLALMTAGTVALISTAYSHIIEEFPNGGGGYLVASKLLGPRWGLVSGSALLVDYVLTITTSIAACGDALFSLAPPGWQGFKLGVELGLVALLTLLNMRGVKESVMILLPIHIVFILTHLVLIGGGIGSHANEMGATVVAVRSGWGEAMRSLGGLGVLMLLLHAYSLGGGTYTGLEAVSNGMAIMREPRVRTGRRTMLLMAVSLAVCAAGLLICYLLWNVAPEPGKTLNAVLADRMARGVPGGAVFVFVTLLSEGALLFVAAQTGFIDGPRVLANMALDSWVPHRFAALSERLTTHNGILLMCGAALAALLYTRGDVAHLVVMYSINVFVTFSLSMVAMTRRWWSAQGDPHRGQRLALFAATALLCITILVVTTTVKFREGGWITLFVTGLVIWFCLSIRRHYDEARAQMIRLQEDVDNLPPSSHVPGELKRTDPVAALLVGDFGGLGLHTLLNVFRTFPGYYKGVVFISAGVVDSGEFKGGSDAVTALQARTEEMLRRYEEAARRLGLPATSRFEIGTDAVDAAEKICLAVAKEYPRATFFAGKLVFKQEQWWHRLLHNETAYAIQRRLHWAGLPMMTLPARVMGTAT